MSGDLLYDIVGPHVPSFWGSQTRWFLFVFFLSTILYLFFRRTNESEEELQIEHAMEPFDWNTREEQLREIHTLLSEKESQQWIIKLFEHLQTVFEFLGVATIITSTLEEIKKQQSEIYRKLPDSAFSPLEALYVALYTEKQLSEEQRESSIEEIVDVFKPLVETENNLYLS